ncbi:hypothetical protein [Rhodococcus sp. IEGM 1318]|nr:hypothetical protein [Rhodococcus sp. IEGM 1318]MDV8009596.1 hypothetical protein [Rhodococcus sp. IEGM 1318]
MSANVGGAAGTAPDAEPKTEGDPISTSYRRRRQMAVRAGIPAEAHC